MGFYGFYDATYLLVLIGAALCMAASAHVKSTFTRYSGVASRSGLTGAQASSRLLQWNGENHIPVRPISGKLTDHYDPRTDTISLSETVYGSTSISAIGVAAHETGHAMQHAKGYFPLTLRSTMVPAVNICSTISWPLILIGLLYNSNSAMIFVNLGVALFSVAVLFHLVTLPVELNASRRGLAMLRETGILNEDELHMARKVLTAAALTYVASAASAVLQLLRILLLANGKRRN